MATIVRRQSFVELVEHELHYEYVGDPGRGFSFACNPSGRPFPMNPIANQNYIRCKDGTYPVRFVGIRVHIKRIRIPAVILCENCHSKLELHDAWINTCDCGADYNGSGQRLAPRYMWGEETGEHWCDTVLAGR